MWYSVVQHGVGHRWGDVGWGIVAWHGVGSQVQWDGAGSQVVVWRQVRSQVV